MERQHLFLDRARIGVIVMGKRMEGGWCDSASVNGGETVFRKEEVEELEWMRRKKGRKEGGPSMFQILRSSMDASVDGFIYFHWMEKTAWAREYDRKVLEKTDWVGGDYKKGDQSGIYLSSQGKR